MIPEAGLKEIQAKALSSAGGCGSPVETITALLEKTLTDLRVSFSLAHARKCSGQPQLQFQSFQKLCSCLGSTRPAVHLQNFSFLTDPTGAAQTRPMQSAGAEPLPDSRGEHLDPRTSKEA